MILYHGTSSKYLDIILKKGIKPRANKKSNWSEQSQKEYVYLTDMYPLFFSLQATKTKKDKLVILEIEGHDLDDNLFYPDDDYIWWMQKLKKQPIELEAAGNLIQYNQNIWEESLNMLGCIAYRGIVPVNAIKRYAIIDVNSMNSSGRMFIYSLCDVSVAPLATAYRKPKAQYSLKWIFGDVESAISEDELSVLENLGDNKMIAYHQKANRELNEQRKKFISVITL